jgi:hypothetical protein
MPANRWYTAGILMLPFLLLKGHPGNVKPMWKDPVPCTQDRRGSQQAAVVHCRGL